MTLTKGQHVVITGAAGTCPGEVLHVEESATLPSISGAPEANRIRATMQERHITEIALIAHKYNGRDVHLIALRHATGAWRDLNAQPLTITPIHGFWEIKDPPEEPTT